jgi:LysM repeat protein
MDHLAMSLDTLQKKINDLQTKLAKLEKTPGAKTASTGPQITKKKLAPKKESTAETHTVVVGDTLYGISRRYNLSVAELRSLNHLKKGALLHVGQRLIVNSSGH